MAGDERARLILPVSQREFDLYGLSLDRGPNYDPLEPVSAYCPSSEHLAQVAA